jgi:hypothetical protein
MKVHALKHIVSPPEVWCGIRRVHRLEDLDWKKVTCKNCLRHNIRISRYGTTKKT